MGMLTQFITSTQFYLFGRSRFTQTGWHKAAKKYVQGELEDCKLQGKCYAVTGANSGIGRETAGFLASRGARVLMLCRSIERAEKARDDAVEALQKKEMTRLKFLLKLGKEKDLGFVG